MGGTKGVELLSHLTNEERLSVLSTSAAQDVEDLEQFARYVMAGGEGQRGIGWAERGQREVHGWEGSIISSHVVLRPPMHWLRYQ